MSIAEKLCCPHILEIEPYQSARRIGGSGEVWLNANELPFTGLQHVSPSGQYNRYPEFQSESLLQAYARYAEVDTEQLLCLRGADEGIELLIRCFCTPASDSVIITTPTYGMYQVSAGIHNVEVIQVQRCPDFSIDVDALKHQQDSKLAFICSPNNPTGNVVDRQALVEVLEYYRDSSLVVVDEAYIEFSPGDSAVDLIGQYPNLVVLRTMSKAFGMAALRCGFVVGSQEIIALLKRIAAPYPVPAPVEEIARHALSTTGVHLMRQNVAKIVALRDQFVQDIGQLQSIVRVADSQGNFVLVEFADEQSAVDALSEAGVVVRKPYSQGMLQHCQRISIGTAEEMQQVTGVLRRLG